MYFEETGLLDTPIRRAIAHIPVVGNWIVKLLERGIGYRHHGDMRYLTACRADSSDLRLISKPDDHRSRRPIRKARLGPMERPF